MSELSIRQDDLTSVPTAQNITGGALRLVEWAEEAQAANQLAKALCRTPFAGQYRNDPEAATAAILKGAEVGLTPVTALGAFDLIQGTPAAKAMTLRALVQSHGHEVHVDESTPDRCKIRGRRKGSSEWQPVVWDMNRARKLGLAEKENWRKQPQAMLVARATSEVCRLIASDVILGIAYSAEEVADLEPVPTKTAKRTAKRSAPALPASAPEPPFGEPEPEPDPTPVEEERPDPVTADQSKKLHAQFNDVGITERKDRLAYTAKVIGRKVKSSNELTREEASQVIDALEAQLHENFSETAPEGGESK